jgi:ribosomal protein S18 acetylase RimI-like enzyme
MTPVTVTRATRDDIDAFVTSVAGLFREDGGRHDPTMDVGWPAAEGGPYYAGLVDDEACRLAVARNASGQVIGHLVGELVGPDALRTCRFAVLESIRVDPSARGTGVGSQLIQNFLTWAREKDAEVASVSAFAANAGALRLYERHGFRPQTITLRAAV